MKNDNKSKTDEASCPLKIFVINLARAPDRRQKMARQLQEQQLTYQFFDAVDGAFLSKEEISSVYRESAAFDRLGRSMPANEVACSWSHIKIYEKMFKERIGEALILEDDVDLSSDFGRVLHTRLDWLPKDWRVVNFAHDMSPPVIMNAIPENGLGHISVCRFERVVGRTGAYLISLEGAEALLRYSYPIRMPSDDLVGDSAFVGADVYGLSPRIAIWDDDFHSMIWVDQSREQFAEKSRSGFTGFIKRLRRRFKKLL